MELTQSIPISDIYTPTLLHDLSGSVKFKITDVNLTEMDFKHNPIVTRIGKKQKINVTVSGYVTEPYHISSCHIKGHEKPRKRINIKDKVLNITFFSVRVLRDEEWDYDNKRIITVPRLMVDNTHDLYGFLKPIYVNDDLMDIKSEKNIYLTFGELKTYLEGITVELDTVNKGIVNPDIKWVVKYMKGDNDGE